MQTANTLKSHVIMIDRVTLRATPAQAFDLSTRGFIRSIGSPMFARWIACDGITADDIRAEIANDGPDYRGADVPFGRDPLAMPL